MPTVRNKKVRAADVSSDSRLIRVIHESVFIVSIACAIFLLLALITYHSQDPGWSKTGLGDTIANAGGFLGAWLADIFLCAFGIMAYLFPFMIVYAAWIPCRNRISTEHGHLLFILRLVGFLLLLLSGSAFFALNISSNLLPFNAGGLTGNLLITLMLPILNILGTNLLLIAFILTGITLFTSLSWLKVIDSLGKLSLGTVDLLGRAVLSIKLPQIAKEADDDAQFEPKIKPKNKRVAILASESSTEQIVPTKKRMPIISNPAPIKSGARSEKERQLSMFEPDAETYLPPLALLDNLKPEDSVGYTEGQLENLSVNVEMRLSDFGIDAQVVAVHPGPVVTRFELQLAAGTKVSRITALSKDLARSLSVISVRIVEIIPGKSVIGLELPNMHREIVRLREILSSQKYEQARMPLALALGKDIAGHPVIVNLARMPHLLVAGTTGAGKSVCLNAILLSILYKYVPSDVRMILIDPKMLELSIYEGIPHLLAPVVTNMKEAANALRWCVIEMERRYKLMMSLGVRNISGFNHKVREARNAGKPILDPLWENALEDPDAEPPELEEFPYIVVIADEYADMIMVVGKKVEELIARIAQKARAAGIHLILATQRPSVDVVTGLIKANIPARIAFQVSSKVDSRTILDQSGAEQLLGFGDMLYLAPGTGIPTRIHGSFVADEEVHNVVQDLKKHGMAPRYLQEILEGGAGGSGGNGDVGAFGLGIDGEDADSEQDPLYDEAVKIVTETRRASISSIQRRLRIGYNRAARIVEAMEAAGVVSAMETNGSREVLAPPPVTD